MWFAVLMILAAPERDPCSGLQTAVFVNAERRTAYSCENGKKQSAYRVALGRGGIGKRVEGDGKLPLGEYSLGTPRASKYFHLFIPVGYPTADQRRRGYTGGAVGVHGPTRMAQGPFTTDVDWTLGCIAVGTDGEIDSLASWIRDKRVKRIVIRER